MPRKVKQVADALVAKGMSPPDDSHHKMYRKTVNGVTQLVTRISHGSRKADISDTIATRMAHQCCLQLNEFWRLVDCPMTEDEWDTLVAKRCADGRNPFLQ